MSVSFLFNVRLHGQVVILLLIVTILGGNGG
jgi:hypothetical protein